VRSRSVDKAPSLSAYISASSIGQIFAKFDVGDLYENLSGKSEFGLNQVTYSALCVET